MCIRDRFEKEDINPNTILEGMFGHTQKISNDNNLSSVKNSNHNANSNAEIQNKIIKPTVPTNVKVVDFTDKTKSKEKIKVKYF